MDCTAGRVLALKLHSSTALNMKKNIGDRRHRKHATWRSRDVLAEIQAAEGTP